MNNDIRLSTGFYSHPKTIKLMRIVGAEGVLCLQRLWIWSAQNRADGNLAGFEDEDIEIAACWPGACGEFVQALAKLRFLDGNTGEYALHGWDEHQAYVVKEAERISRASAGAAKKWGTSVKDQNKQTRAQRLSAAREKATHTNEEWSQMVSFFDHTCVRCGARETELVQDHIVPLYQGGCDGIQNIQPLCRRCNSSKGPEAIDFRVKYCRDHGVKIPQIFSPDACKNACECLLMPADGKKTPAPNQTKPSIRREDSLRSSSCPEHHSVDSGPMPATLDAVITLPLNTGEEHPVTQGEIDQWQDLYPSVDVPQALRSMKGWLIANRQKRKTKTGISRFVQAWLGREQDRGGGACGSRAAPAGNAKQESQADRAARLTFEAGMSVLEEMEQRGTQGGRALNAR